MAHAFDTGLAAPSRSLIRTRALALLAPLAAPTGYLAAVVPFGAVVRSWTDDAGIDLLVEALSGRAPAIGVALGDGVSSPQGDRFHFTEDVELLLYHVSNQARDLVTGRLATDVAGAASNQADPGLEVAMAHAKELLVGQFMHASSPAIKHCRPDREAELTSQGAITIWLQTFQVRLSYSINRNRGVAQLLESIGWRTTREEGEVSLPTEPPLNDTTIDAITDDLAPED